MKTIIFSLSGIGTLLLVFLRLEIFEDYLFDSARGSFLTSNIELIHNVLLLFPIVLFFSIITYKAPDKVFKAWWNFALFSAPAIFIGSVIVNLGYFHNDGGFLNMNDTVDLVLLSGMYLLFTLGSIIQIIRGYRRK